MLKLPKNTLKHPRCAEIEAYFTSNEGPLRPGSDAAAAHWTLTDKLRGALRRSAASQHLERGLEHISTLLAREAKGIRAVQEKAGLPETQRLSRLLLLASDGTSRFYRDVEALLLENGNRVVAVVLAATADELGQLTTPKGTPVKALLIADRQALELFLAEMLPDSP